MATGSVTFSTLIVGNYTIGNRTFSLTQSGSFPSENYTITSATMTIDKWAQWSSSASLVVTGNNYQLGIYSEAYNESVHSISFSLTTQKVYEGLSSITFSSSTGNSAGSIRSGAIPTIVVTYEYDTSPTYTYVYNPSIVTLSKSVTSPNGTATLAWSGASGNTSGIAGFWVQRSINGSALTTIQSISAAGATSGSTTVTASSTNGETYVYRVYTVPANSTVQNGGGVSPTPSLLATQAKAPTSIVVNNTTPSPGATFTLSWSGASGSTSNGIAGYDVYRSATLTGTFSKISSISTSSASGSISLTAPSANGASYFFKVITKGTAASECASPISTAYATVTATKKAVFAPTTVGISSPTAPPGGDIYLYWSGASAGDSAIVGYNIYRDTSLDGSFTTLVEQIDTASTSSGLLVQSPLTVGNTYYFKIQTLSQDVGYDSDLSSAYASVTAATPPSINGTIGKTNASGWY